MSTFSQSEVSNLVQCPQKWGFSYGDIAGFPLRPRVPHLRLREGRAWGAAVQAWHTRRPDEIGHAPALRAHDALMASLNEDAAWLEEQGAFDETEYDNTREKLGDALVHYMATAERLNLVGSEVELQMPHADGWTYKCHLDGIHQDEDGHLWVVEFKLRGAGRFTPLEQVVLWRQVRWYALALAESPFVTGWRPEVAALGYEAVRGVIVDERLNGAAKPVAFNKNGSVSATQSCLLEAYLYECELRGQEPHPPTVDRLRSRVWQQRHEILFRPDELDDALAELESAATLLRLYRRHTLRPIRHPGSWCSTCAFLPICAVPKDEELRNALYVRDEKVTI